MRIAIIEITEPIYADMQRLMSVLDDAGITVLPGDLPGIQANMRLIAGDALPDICDGGLYQVAITFTAEAYGKQRLTRVAGIQPIARATLSLAPL